MKIELQCVPRDLSLVKQIEKNKKRHPSQKILAMTIVNPVDC